MTKLEPPRVLIRAGQPPRPHCPEMEGQSEEYTEGYLDRCGGDIGLRPVLRLPSRLAGTQNTTEPLDLGSTLNSNYPCLELPDGHQFDFHKWRELLVMGNARAFSRQLATRTPATTVCGRSTHVLHTRAPYTEREAADQIGRRKSPRIKNPACTSNVGGASWMLRPAIACFNSVFCVRTVYQWQDPVVWRFWCSRSLMLTNTYDKGGHNALEIWQITGS